MGHSLELYCHIRGTFNVILSGSHYDTNPTDRDRMILSLCCLSQNLTSNYTAKKPFITRSIQSQIYQVDMFSAPGDIGHFAGFEGTPLDMLNSDNL